MDVEAEYFRPGSRFREPLLLQWRWKIVSPMEQENVHSSEHWVSGDGCSRVTGKEAAGLREVGEEGEVAWKDADLGVAQEVVCMREAWDQGLLTKDQEEVGNVA